MCIRDRFGAAHVPDTGTPILLLSSTGTNGNNWRQYYDTAIDQFSGDRYLLQSGVTSGLSTVVVYKNEVALPALTGVGLCTQQSCLDAKDNLIMFSTTFGCFLSTDSGASFGQVVSGVGRGVAVDQTTGDYAYAIQSSGLTISTGHTYSTGTGRGGNVALSGNYVLYTEDVSTGGVIYLSTNGGTSFTPKITGLSRVNGYPPDVAMSNSGQYMYAVSRDKFYSSSDYGSTWTLRATLPANSYRKVSCDHTGQYVSISGPHSNDYVYISIDYGASFLYSIYTGSLAGRGVAIDTDKVLYTLSDDASLITTTYFYGVTLT